MSVDDTELDLVLAALLTGLALNQRVTERIAAAGHPDLRFSHGFLFQHVIPGPLAVGELARRMGVTQQAASKAVGELVRLGYLERTADPADARVRRIGLSPRGLKAVDAGRGARAAVARELADQLGQERADALRAELLAALTAAGGMDAVRARRVPPVR